jgi:hypothetical protein
VKASLIAWIVGIAAALAFAALVFDAAWWKTALAVLMGAAVLRLGLTMIRGLAQPVPEPAEPGELRKVKLVYRCSICGAEVKMTVAPSEDPEPPRHCLEDMDLVTPIDDR